MSAGPHADPAFENRVQRWESFYRAASSTEEFAHVEALARVSGEKAEASCGLMRSTYPKEAS